MDHEKDTERVDDAAIQAILDQAEAGVNDLVEAYEPIEKQYFHAVQTTAPIITYSIDTSPR